MARIEAALYEMGRLDTLAAQDTALHRLDPRAKVITAGVFIVTVASFGKYEISSLLPLVLYPVALLAVGNLPPVCFLKALLVAAPFVLFVGLFNPLLDRETLVQVGSAGISGGWVSFASILLRFALTVSAALILVASTGLYPMSLALERLKVPRAFVIQLLFLYRYLFVLTGEALRIVRAHSLRSGGRRRMTLRVMGSVVGHLLLRTLDRAHRIHLAMRCRGFDGTVRLARVLRFGLPEAAFVLGWSAFFILVRLHNIPQWLGNRVMGLMQ